MAYNYKRKTKQASGSEDSTRNVLEDIKTQSKIICSTKVACTNWKRIFMLLTGQTNTTDVLAIPASAAHEKSIFTKLSKYSTTDINILLKTYTKFLFVRHPFERLLSAFRNKLEQHYLSSKYFQSRFGRFIIKHYRYYNFAMTFQRTFESPARFKDWEKYLRKAVVLRRHLGLIGPKTSNILRGPDRLESREFVEEEIIAGSPATPTSLLQW
ncbi:unnamed protein product [Timema podura]|uniref:Carbohydrate sulfotransferase n=1 Tax=Timema podura TaxID=61482 RepID=A0ABN7NLV9_TIMPD|nr:unnamed protein product [Timema podura]